MKYGQRMMASTPFQKARCKKPTVKSHPANQENADMLWFFILIFSIYTVYQIDRLNVY